MCPISPTRTNSPAELSRYARHALVSFRETVLTEWERDAGVELDRTARPFDMYSDAWRGLYDRKDLDPRDAHTLLVILEVVEKLDGLIERFPTEVE